MVIIEAVKGDVKTTAHVHAEGATKAVERMIDYCYTIVSITEESNAE